MWTHSLYLCDSTLLYRHQASADQPRGFHQGQLGGTNQLNSLNLGNRMQRKWVSPLCVLWWETCHLDTVICYREGWEVRSRDIQFALKKQKSWCRRLRDKNRKKMLLGLLIPHGNPFWGRIAHSFGILWDAWFLRSIFKGHTHNYYFY